MIRKQYLPFTINMSKLQRKIQFLIFLLIGIMILCSIKYYYNYSKLDLLEFYNNVVKSTSEDTKVVYKSSTTICAYCNDDSEYINILVLHKNIPFIKELENCITYDEKNFFLDSSCSKWYLFNSEEKKLSTGKLTFSELSLTKCMWFSNFKINFKPTILLEVIRLEKSDSAYISDWDSQFEYNYYIK